ncbi:AMP-binding protein, partial [Lonsdalea populi]
VPASPDDVAGQLQAHTDPRSHRLDLNQAPLFAVDIAHDPAHNEWLLALRFHHLVSDHMTLALIVNEIRLLVEGRSDALPVPLPYRDFIAQILNVPLSEHEAYFRDRLADVDTPTAPFGLLDVQGEGEDVLEASLPLDTALAATIRTQARRLGVSPGVLFHAACALVLAHTSGRDDVVFGSVLSGRLQGNAGADQMMGMFINTLPLRIVLAGQSAQDLVQSVSHALTALLAHEQAPLTLAQRCSGVAQPMPLFSALFNYRHSLSDPDAERWDDIRILASEERTNFPLTLSVDDLGEAFRLTAKTVAGVDPMRMIRYMLTAISHLIAALESAAQQPALSLPVLPDAERRQLLEAFNATDADFPQHALIHQQFEAQAARTPDALAVLFEDDALTYDQLNRRANQLAHHLISLGVRPDDRVALCVERGLDMMVGLLGILKAGAAYVPLDPAYPAERLAYMLDDAQPVALLTQTALREAFDDTRPVLLLDTPA